MQPESSSARLFHLLARYTYLQELVEHKRVLVLGQADASLAESLDRQGISRALIIDTSEERVEEARRLCTTRRVTFEVGPLSQLGGPDRSFDVAIIDDFAALEDRAREIIAARGALTPAGVLVACTGNPDSAGGLSSGSPGQVSYYEFYGQLADNFRFVRMIGQCPMVGFALADLSADDPETSITFDSSLLPEGSEDAEFFVAFCSASSIDPDPFSVIQVPLDWIKRQLAASPNPAGTSTTPPPADYGVLDQLQRQLIEQTDASAEEIAKLKLDIDRRAVTVAKLENHLREAREKAALEHNRVVQTKLALEAERKKFLSFTKEVEMDRRLQLMGPTEDSSLVQARAEKESFEQKLIMSEESQAFFEGRALGFAHRLAEERSVTDELGLRIALLSDELKDVHGALSRVDELEEALANERQARSQAEAKLAETGADDGRTDDLMGELAKERADRKLAEVRVDELRQRLRVALTSGTRMTPVQKALNKAESVFGGGADHNEELAKLRDELKREREARLEVQTRLERIEQLGGGPEAFTVELNEERALRQKAEEQVAHLDERLSQSEAVAARLSAEGSARQRAEAVFGTIDRPPPSAASAANDVELSRERKARQDAQAELSRLKAERIEANKLRAELDHSESARRQAESALEIARGHRDAIDTVREELERSEAERIKAEEQLRKSQGSRDEVARLEASLEDALRAQREVEIERDQLKAKADQPESTGDEAAEANENEGLAEGLADLRGRLGQALRARRRIQEEKAELGKRLQTREQELGALRDEGKVREDLLRQVLSELQISQIRLPEVTSILERREGELIELRRRLEGTESEAAELTAQITQRDRELADLSGEVQGLKWRMDESSLLGAAGRPVANAAALSSSAAQAKATSSAGADSHALEIDLARVRGRSEVLESERDRLVVDLKAAQDELKTLHAGVARLETELVGLRSQRDASEVTRVRLQAQLREAEGRASESIGKAALLERELSALKIDSGDVRQRLGSIEARRQELQIRYEKLHEELQTTRDEALNATRDLAASQACMAMLEDQLPGVSQMMDEPLELSLGRGDDERSLGDTQVLGFPAPRIRPARAPLSESDHAYDAEEMRELKASNAKLVEEIERLESEANEAASTISGLRVDLEAALVRADEVSAESTRHLEGISEIESRLAEVQTELDDCIARRAELEAQIQALSSAPDPSEAALLQLASQTQLLDSARGELQAREGMISGLTFRISELDAALSTPREAPAQDAQIRQEIASISAEKAECEQALVAARQESVEKAASIDELRDQLSRYEAQVAELRGSVEQARAQAAAFEFVQSQADEWAERMEKAELQSEQLQRELAQSRARRERPSSGKAEIEGLRQTVRELRSRISELGEAKQLAEESIERLFDHLVSVKGDADVLGELLTDRDDEIDHLASTLAQVKEQATIECVPCDDPEPDLEPDSE